MKTYKCTIEVNKGWADNIQQLLNANSVNLHEMNYRSQSCIHTETAVFENGYQADIKVCTSTDDLFIDSVLFDETGHEIGLLDIGYEILGEYKFERDDEIYIVELKKKMEKAG